MNGTVYFLMYSDRVRAQMIDALSLMSYGMYVVSLTFILHPEQFVTCFSVILVGTVLLTRLMSVFACHLHRELRVMAAVGSPLYLGACILSLFLIYPLGPTVKFPIGHPESAVEVRSIALFFSWREEVRVYSTSAHHSYRHGGKVLLFDTKYDGAILDFHRRFGSSQAFADSSGAEVIRFAESYFTGNPNATMVGLALQLQQGLPGLSISNVVLGTVPEESSLTPVAIK